MKRLLTVFIVFLSVSISAQQTQQGLTRKQKKAAKTANEFDVLKYLPETTTYNAYDFWEAIVSNNETFKANMAKFDKPGSLAKKALAKVGENASLTSLMNANYNVDLSGELNNTIRDLMFGKKELYPEVNFRVYSSSEFNAFTTPSGYIYISTNALDKASSNLAMLYALMGHEVAHYVYNHMLIHEYMALKKEQTNNIGAAIAAIGSATANMAAVANGGVYIEGTEKNMKKMVDDIQEMSKAYYYRYGREQEIEADIVAYRFIEWMGEDPSVFIKMLETISGGWIGKETERYDDHPSAIDRIEILKALSPSNYKRLGE